DAKKEEFRKYLERSGVIDALTKVLVGLYEEPEKPSNAIECATAYSTRRTSTCRAPPGLLINAVWKIQRDGGATSALA
ncbi:hypothetical protein EMIHUDRAFT_68044, partial [Emiliania huxleyi CCMP1516]|uniref:Uncharacterized protein n=2 Tax=Emiliania huxleyi TaxID=2903 RepID=A0A0D3ICI3_EMIH1